MAPARHLDPDQALVLIIDVQQKLLPHVHGASALAEALEQLVAGAALFGLPLVATEQYPQGIGHTDPQLRTLLRENGAVMFEKMSFSCCADQRVTELLGKIGRSQVIVAGIEAHVCVLQTCLDLLAMEYQVYVGADAIGSRRSRDYDVACQRLLQAGAVLTTVESVLFDLCQRCDTAEFKKMISLIKDRPVTPTDVP